VVEETNISSNPAPSCEEITDDFGSVEKDQNSTRRHDAFFSYESSSNVKQALVGRALLARRSSMQSVLGTKAMHSLRKLSSQ